MVVEAAAAVVAACQVAAPRGRHHSGVAAAAVLVVPVVLPPAVEALFPQVSLCVASLVAQRCLLGGSASLAATAAVVGGWPDGARKGWHHPPVLPVVRVAPHAVMLLEVERCLPSLVIQVKALCA